MCSHDSDNGDNAHQTMLFVFYCGPFCDVSELDTKWIKLKPQREYPDTRLRWHAFELPARAINSAHFTAFSVGHWKMQEKVRRAVYNYDLIIRQSHVFRVIRKWLNPDRRNWKRLCGMLEIFVLNEVNCLAGEWVSYKRWSHSNGLLFCRRTLSLSLSATFTVVLHVWSKNSTERDMWYTRHAF